MSSFEPHKVSLGYVAAILAVLLFGSYVIHADDKKKESAPAKAPAKTAPAPKAGGGGANHGTGGGGAASHGPTTAGSGSHGPTTSGSGAHGPTTAGSGSHGATTAGTGGHGATTAGTGGHGATTAGATTHGGNTGSTTHGGNTGNTTHGGNAGNTAHGGTAGNAGHGGNAGNTAHGGAAGSKPLPKGHAEVHTAKGDTVVKRANGKTASVHDAKRGMDIHHGLNGNRRVEVVHGDRRIVAERGRRGFVERPYRYHGREYGHRTYYYNGRAYDRFYHGYPYHGVYVQMYTPAYYYQPAFYGWAYNPWVTPVPYAWGWGGNPWYGYYGGYFAPYPVYPSASVWLTDYMVSATLAAAYQAKVEADGAAAAQARVQAEGAAPLTPEVKNLIATEVQRQIAIENAESKAQAADPNPAMSGIQAMLSDNVRHVFVAGSSLDVTDASGTECAISEGDALQLSGPPGADATAANLVMLSSKGGQECRKGSTVSVAVADLQEMQNHMRETIDQGMNELQTKQGKGGLPTLPASASAAPTKAAFAAEAPGPDPTAEKEIAEQSREADQAEKEVLADASGGGPSAPSNENTAQPVSFQPMGKSIDEITTQYGQPKNIVDLGAKKIYVYKDMKVTFKNGSVTDVQ